jgi:HEAT repeat protein
MLTAWAIMGYLKFRKSVPPALLAAGVNSPQWKARAAVVETIAGGKPDKSHLPILRKLLRDDNAMIRRRAARAIGYIGGKSPETIGALIEALGLKGDSARAAVAAALCTLTDKKWAYRIKATAEEKSEIIQKWQQWWKF